MKLTILTYNIHKGFSIGNIRFSLHGMKSAIHALNPDIIFLQEVQGSHLFFSKIIPLWPSTTQADALAGTHYPYHVYSENVFSKEGHHGNAILSKYPILRYENINVAKSANASRSVLHAEIQLPSGIITHAICVHFGLFDKERTAQLHRLSQRINSHVPHNAPLILGGDFNDWQQKATDHLETEAHMQEAFQTLYGYHARTFPVARPILRVDRIYYRDILLEEATCLSQQPWKKLSDHAPLYARFNIGNVDDHP